MVLQCSKLFYSKVFSEFLRQDSHSSFSFGKIQNVGDPDSSFSFGKIQNVGDPELSEEKNLVFQWRKISYFVFTYIFPLVLLFISPFHIYIYTVPSPVRSFIYICLQFPPLDFHIISGELP